MSDVVFSGLCVKRVCILVVIVYSPVFSVSQRPSLSPFQPVPASFSPFQPVSVRFSLFPSASARSSPLQPVPARFSPFQPVSARFSPFKPVSVRFSPFKPVSVRFSPFQPVSARFSPIPHSVWPRSRLRWIFWLVWLPWVQPPCVCATAPAPSFLLRPEFTPWALLWWLSFTVNTFKRLQCGVLLDAQNPRNKQLYGTPTPVTLNPKNWKI